MKDTGATETHFDKRITMTPSLYYRKCLCLKGHSEKVKKGIQQKRDAA